MRRAFTIQLAPTRPPFDVAAAFKRMGSLPLLGFTASRMAASFAQLLKEQLAARVEIDAFRDIITLRPGAIKCLNLTTLSKSFRAPVQKTTQPQRTLCHRIMPCWDSCAIDSTYLARRHSQRLWTGSTRITGGRPVDGRHRPHRTSFQTKR